MIILLALFFISGDAFSGEKKMFVGNFKLFENPTKCVIQISPGFSIHTTRECPKTEHQKAMEKQFGWKFESLEKSTEGAKPTEQGGK